MKTIKEYLTDVCTNYNKDNETKTVGRWIKKYPENPTLFLEMCSIFSVGQIAKPELVHGKSDQYRINSFIYEHEDFTAIIRTFSPLYKGTRPSGIIELEILK